MSGGENDKKKKKKMLTLFRAAIGSLMGYLSVSTYPPRSDAAQGRSQSNAFLVAEVPSPCTAHLCGYSITSNYNSIDIISRALGFHFILEAISGLYPCII
jgi:hypothetical protein